MVGLSNSHLEMVVPDSNVLMTKLHELHITCDVTYKILLYLGSSTQPVRSRHLIKFKTVKPDFAYRMSTKQNNKKHWKPRFNRNVQKTCPPLHTLMQLCNLSPHFPLPLKVPGMHSRLNEVPSCSCRIAMCGGIRG